MARISIFNEEGDRFVVDNIEAMLTELPDEAFEVIYKPTRYYHEYNQMICEMIEKNIIQQTEGPKYDSEAVERGLKAFEGEIIKRFDEETLKEWQVETDAQWEANKPKDRSDGDN